MQELAVETRGLRKTYVSNKKQPGMLGAVKSLIRPEHVETHAVQGVDLRIERGELVGFLGPNGAGKTTTLKMLSGILFPTAGQALVLGHVPSKRDPDMLRRISLVMGNKQQLWWDLPAWDSFVVLKELYEVDDAQFKKRVDRLVEALELGDKVQSQVRKMSLGERMKCELVAALLHNPQIVFLDEPTIGLDVVSQKRIRDFLQELCDRVVVIDHGSIVFEGTLDYLSAKFSDSRRLKLTLSSAVNGSDLTRFGKVIEVTESQVTFEVPRCETAAVTAALLQALPVIDVAIEEVDIEEVIRDLFTSKRT